jgi:hypothetical protein
VPTNTVLSVKYCMFLASLYTAYRDPIVWLSKLTHMVVVEYLCS